MLDSVALRARLDGVRDRVMRAARRAGRDASSVRVVAVSKTFTAEDVRAAAVAGQVDFGENKVQEALQKMGQTSDLHIKWHLVGHVQSNKARKAGAQFDYVHSVDRAELATKHGTREEDLAPIFDAARGCRAVRIVGLMLLPPAVADPGEARPYFRELRDVRDRLLARGVDASMVRELSMGMSHDFEVAVEEGATMVRVGTAIFGQRNSMETSE